MRVWASHGAHRIKPHAVSGFEHRFDRREIEQGFHQGGVIGDRVHHIDDHIAQMAAPDGRKVCVMRLQNMIFGDRQSVLIHCFGHGFGGRAAVGHVEFDAEILIRAAGVVAGRQDDATIGFVQPYQMAGGWR